MEIFRIVNLVGLNLSHNKFSGSLPISMGTISSVQSLDFLVTDCLEKFPSHLRVVQS